MRWIRHHPAARVHTVLERIRKRVQCVTFVYKHQRRCRDQANTQNGSLGRRTYHTQFQIKMPVYEFCSRETDTITLFCRDLKKEKQVTK